jgi:hypothetical protein
MVLKFQEAKKMKIKSRGIKLKHSAAFKDLVVIIVIGIPLFAFALIFHVFERFAAFHQKYGVGPIDDIIIVFAVLAIAFAVFSLRRCRELRKALSNIRTLQGLLPICASCKRIRDDVGYWNHLEFYMEAHSEAELIHSICPKCLKKLYGIPRPVDKKSSGSVPEGIEE